MIEAGIVLHAEDGRATVRMTRTEACAECGLCHRLAHPARELVLAAGNPRGARTGDLVRVQVPDLGVVRAAFWAYGVPTVFAVAGGAVGWVACGRAGLSAEAGAAAGGIAAMAAGYYAVGRYDRRLRKRWQGPVIVEILSRAGEPVQTQGEGR